MFEELMNKDEIHPEQVFEKFIAVKYNICNAMKLTRLFKTSSMILVKKKLLTMPMAKREIIMFDDKILLITGGTGSFGNAVMKRF